MEKPRFGDVYRWVMDTDGPVMVVMRVAGNNAMSLLVKNADIHPPEDQPGTIHHWTLIGGAAWQKIEEDE